MTLRARTTIHEKSFSLGGFAPLYSNAANFGATTDEADNYRFPQPTRCIIKRVLAGKYLFTYLKQPSESSSYIVSLRNHIAVVELHNERLFFRMNRLAFFEECLELSTTCNMQVPWLCSESPFIACVTGSGRVGIELEAGGDALDSESQSAAPLKVKLPRLAAWSSDTRLQLEVEPGYLNAALMAEATAVVCHSSLVISSNGDGGRGSWEVPMRALRFLMP